jgi:hypothetical protein
MTHSESGFIAPKTRDGEEFIAPKTRDGEEFIAPKTRDGEEFIAQRTSLCVRTNAHELEHDGVVAEIDSR